MFYLLDSIINKVILADRRLCFHTDARMTLFTCPFSLEMDSSVESMPSSLIVEIKITFFFYSNSKIFYLQ